LADLGDLDISEEARKRRKLGPRERDEGIERADAETLLQCSLATYRIEMRARARRERGARFLDLAAERGIGGEIVADEDLARLDAGQLAPQGACATLSGDQLAGRNIERGERVSLLGAVLGRRPEQGGEEIVGAGVEQRLFGQGPRRHQTDDVA